MSSSSTTTSSSTSSDRSSSPDEGAAVAAAGLPAAAQTPATVTPAPKRKRKASAAQAPDSAALHAMVEVYKAGLGVLYSKEMLDRMVAAIMSSANVQQAVAVMGGHDGGGKRAKGTAQKQKGRQQSAYSMFITQIFAALKEAGISNVGLQDVSPLWQAIPADVKLEITERFNAIKAAFNVNVDAGEAPNLTAALKAYEREHGLAPVNFLRLYEQFKDSAKAAAAARGDDEEAKPKAAKKAAAAPAPAAAAAAAGAADGGDKPAKKQKKDKEGKKEKKQKAEAEAAPTTEKKKKKHKHAKPADSN